MKVAGVSVDAALVEAQAVVTVAAQLQEVIQNPKAHIVEAVLQEEVIHPQGLLLPAAVTAVVVQQKRLHHVQAQQHGRNRPLLPARNQRIILRREIAPLQKVVKPLHSSGST